MHPCLILAQAAVAAVRGVAVPAMQQGNLVVSERAASGAAAAHAAAAPPCLPAQVREPLCMLVVEGSQALSFCQVLAAARRGAEWAFCVLEVD